MVMRVAVVGGGIAGLAAAWELVGAPGADWPELSLTVLEGSPAVGGKLRLDSVGGRVVDVGAESVLARRPEAMTLLGELGLADRVVHPAPVSASIVSRGRRWPLPAGTLMGVPSDAESVRGLLTDAEVSRLEAEVGTPPVKGDVAVGTFFDDRLGPAVTDRLVEPLLAGVYAGHSRHLSLEMSVPALHVAAQEGRSVLETVRAVVEAAASGPTAGTPVFASLRGGIGALPEILSAALRDKGVEVLTGATARRLRRVGGEWVLATGPTTDETERPFDAVVLATPAAPAARLLRDECPTAASLLASIEYASMAIVTLALEGEVGELAGSSGFLVPPTEPLTIKASTFSSDKWPWLRERDPDRTFLRASIGRHREEATLQHPDEALVDMALRDLATVLGGALPTPVDAHVQRWGGGLPQYAVGHRELVARARAALPPGLVVSGAAYDGVGIPACIGSGRTAAAVVRTHVRGGAVRLGG
ncbi:MAG TPA: protoporphyrinogen oxidase [Intrasporangium sp.]|uniref:protoporphyrinogen oxidase n=1 Tax=Intrasporangium sp. TaxID=1925024 RepID=UPI002D767CFF|nr:protoporphyrinogen oxidase [Intrasporangium sp.]HET7396977.1 protoporphyrinogen oxidase [Intrasporangium sp.]